MSDRYSSYSFLSACEEEGTDYRVRYRLAASPFAIIAPHGGGIEAGTSEIADAVAGRDHSFYAFEGIRGRENAELHLASTRFDEPRGLQVVSRSSVVLAIHGRDREDEVVSLGGLHGELIAHLAAALERAGYSAVRHHEPNYAGIDPDNICNRGRSGRGVQVELPRGLRRRLFPALNASGRRVRTCALRHFRNAVRGALKEWIRAGSAGPAGRAEMRVSSERPDGEAEMGISSAESAAVALSRGHGQPGSWVALVREVSPRIAACELTHRPRQAIDLDLARRQHAAYAALLQALGCAVRWLPPTPELPDSVFVEDTAVVLAELAILARPGAASRRAEIDTIAPVLGGYRPIFTIAGPGTLDGGDVLVAGKRIFIGLSARTNEAAVDQVRGWVEPFGYQVRTVRVALCLHLKSAATAVSDDRVLINPGWVDSAAFAGMDLIEVNPAEPSAANALRLGPAVVMDLSHSSTRRRLEAAGQMVHGIDLSELAKAEGAITCCSVVFSADARETWASPPT